MDDSCSLKVLSQTSSVQLAIKGEQCQSSLVGQVPIVFGWLFTCKIIIIPLCPLLNEHNKMTIDYLGEEEGGK